MALVVSHKVTGWTRSATRRNVALEAAPRAGHDVLANPA